MSYPALGEVTTFIIGIAFLFTVLVVNGGDLVVSVEGKIKLFVFVLGFKGIQRLVIAVMLIDLSKTWGVNPGGSQFVFVKKLCRLPTCPLLDEAIHCIIALFEDKPLWGSAVGFIAVLVVLEKQLVFLAACVRQVQFN